MKNNFFIGVILFVLSVLPLLTSAKQPFPTQFTTEEKIYSFSTVWSELKNNFVHMDRINFDIDSLYRSYLPQVIKSRNDVEFFDLLNRFMNRFNDGHTGVGGTNYRWSRYFDFAPVHFDWIGGSYRLCYIMESSGLDSLALGAELIEIDGAPTMQYVEELYFPQVVRGTRDANLDAMARSNNYIGAGLPDSRFRGKLRLLDGTEKPFSIRCNRLRNERNGKGNGRDWWLPEHFIPRNQKITLEPLTDDRYLLDFRAFRMEDIPVLDSLMAVAKEQAKGVIIDLRYCPGGASPVGDRLLQYLIDTDSIQVGVCQTRIGNGYGRSQGNYRPEYEAFYHNRAYENLPPKTLKIDRTKVLRCPIVILIGTRTGSAAETFLIELVELPNRPRIIGNTTTGSTGAPLVIDLPHDTWVRICTLRHLFPVSGKPFDNQGITPDERVVPTLEEYLTGRDVVMNRALELLGNY